MQRINLVAVHLDKAQIAEHAIHGNETQEPCILYDLDQVEIKEILNEEIESLPCEGIVFAVKRNEMCN